MISTQQEPQPAAKATNQPTNTIPPTSTTSTHNDEYVCVRADGSLEELVVPEMWVGDADARVAGLSSSATGHKKANRIMMPPGQRRNPAEDHSGMIDDQQTIYVYVLYIYVII